MKYISATLLSTCLLASGILPTHAQSVSKSKSKDLLKLIGSNKSPQTFKFCDANKATRQCKGTKGLKARGLGGAFIPLALEVKGFRITQRTISGGNAQIVSKFDTEVNKIPPKCKDANGILNASSGKLEFKGFFCNWLAIGNVITRVTLDIDNVDIERKTFSGKYTLRLVGTGNMFGRGHFVVKAK